MTRITLDGYRNALTDLDARLTRTVARDQRELLRLEEQDLPGGPMPSTEDEPNAGLDEVEAGLVANGSALLADVADALRRLDAGAFGKCGTCGKPVGRARLDVLPYARECIGCARVAQAVG